MLAMIAGAPLDDNLQANLIYNDNEDTVKWANTVTMENMRHLELWDNAVCEWVQDDLIKVLHIAGKYNPSNIFKKRR